MFETLTARIAELARRKAEARASILVEALREVLPREIAITAVDQGVRLAGRGLSRRFALDSSLRWTIAGLIR